MCVVATIEKEKDAVADSGQVKEMPIATFGITSTQTSNQRSARSRLRPASINVVNVAYCTWYDGVEIYKDRIAFSKSRMSPDSRGLEIICDLDYAKARVNEASLEKIRLKERHEKDIKEREAIPIFSLARLSTPPLNPMDYYVWPLFFLESLSFEKASLLSNIATGSAVDEGRLLMKAKTLSPSNVTAEFLSKMDKSSDGSFWGDIVSAALPPLKTHEYTIELWGKSKTLGILSRIKENTKGPKEFLAAVRVDPRLKEYFSGTQIIRDCLRA